MANVYRRGRKSVHIGWPGGPGVPVAQVNECGLDPGGTWSPAIPPGPRCEACFGVVAARRTDPARNARHPNGRGQAVVAAGTAALLAVAVVASSLDEPVNYFPVDSSLASATAYASPTPTSYSVTPGPSATPSAAPVLTPAPPKETHNLPVTSPEPGITQPTYPPIPTYPPFTFPPLPTLPPIVLPTLPPIPKADCRHPGEHFGNDGCKWPHQ